MPFSFTCMYKPCEYNAQSYKPALAIQSEYLALSPQLLLPGAAAGGARCFACLSDHADNMLWWFLFMPEGDVQALGTCLQTYAPSTDQPLLQKTARAAVPSPQAFSEGPLSLEIAMASFLVCGVSVG